MVYSGSWDEGDNCRTGQLTLEEKRDDLPIALGVSKPDDRIDHSDAAFANQSESGGTVNELVITGRSAELQYGACSRVAQADIVHRDRERTTRYAAQRVSSLRRHGCHPWREDRARRRRHRQIRQAWTGNHRSWESDDYAAGAPVRGSNNYVCGTTDQRRGIRHGDRGRRCIVARAGIRRLRAYTDCVIEDRSVR